MLCMPPQQEETAESGNGPSPRREDRTGSDIQLRGGGPIQQLIFRDMVNKRVTGKGWGVIFVCMATSAVHLERAKSYSTDSFIYALRRFILFRGTPSKIQSDRGTQLVAAARQVGGWDFSEIRDWCATKKFTWEPIPTGAQHQTARAPVWRIRNVLIRIRPNR